MVKKLTPDQSRAIVEDYFIQNQVGVTVKVDKEPPVYHTTANETGVWLVNIFYETKNIHYDAAMRDAYPAERFITIQDTVAVEDLTSKIVFQYYFGGGDKFELAN